MPQYPGGIEALKKFIQRNAQQPDDLEEGQRIVVVAQFVVDASGNIINIGIEQKGRKDLDMEVMKVIKKMPQWIPGKQNGRSVPVYFRLPVTFMPQE
jgi:protein TonB